MVDREMGVRDIRARDMVDREMGVRDMAKELKPGDKVEWATSQGTTRGTVEKKQTSPTRIKGHKVAASQANPEFIVRSERSGKKAAHKPGALHKTS